MNVYYNMSTSPKDGAPLGQPGVNTIEEKSTDMKDVNGSRWVIVFASFCILLITDSCSYTVGVLLLELFGEFQGTRAATLVIGSLPAGVLHMIGPFAGILVDVIGARAVVLIGAVISVIGVIAAAFARDIATMSVCFGFLGGLGFGLMYLPATTCVLLHFEDKRALVMGISVCGTGVGAFFFSLVLRQLIDIYTWRGAVLILAAIELHGIPLGLLLVPRHTQKQTSNTSTVYDIMKQCRKGILRNVELLTDPRCICFLLSIAVLSLAFMIPFTLLPDLAVQRGMSKHQASWLLSAMGISAVISRLMLGWLADRTCINRMLLFGVLILFAGVSTAISSLLDTFYANLVYAIVFGYSRGGIPALVPVVLVDLFGSDLVEQSVGLTMLAIGIPGIIGLPLAGWMVDSTGSYTITFVVAGCEILLSGLILLIPRRLIR